MPVTRLDALELREALRDLGRRIEWTSEIEIVIVGGAAGLLTGVLTRRVTTDCDVALHVPAEAWREIHRHAAVVGRQRGLSASWLNAEVRGLARRLPGGWRQRAVEVGRAGALRITAIGRIDLIAMKCIAGRAEDRADLSSLGVTRTEAEFVHEYLRQLQRDHPQERGHVADALELLAHGGIVAGA